MRLLLNDIVSKRRVVVLVKVTGLIIDSRVVLEEIIHIVESSVVQRVVAGSHHIG